MTRKLFATCILSLAFTGVCSAQSAVASIETGTQITQAQAKLLAINAHSPDQYKALAGYYGKEQNKYRRLAAEEKTEWDRRSSQPIVSILAKYPRPVDSARNLYEYYMYKASEDGALETKYNRLAASNAPVNAE